MHELSIALSIIDIAVEESERRGGAIVHAIHIKLGPLSGVVKEALSSAYLLARESSPFRDSRLVIEETSIIVHCAACQAEGRVESMQLMCCSQCGAPTADVIRGRELEITAMEIEDPSTASNQSALNTVVSHE